MTSERDELSSIIIGHDKWNIMPEIAFAAADAIIAAGYIQEGATPSKDGLTIGERITELERGTVMVLEWGVGWGKGIKIVRDAATARFIAREVDVDVYAKMPTGKWVKEA